MNPIQILKSKLVKLNFTEKLSSKSVDTTKLSKEKIIKDGRKVRATFKDEDLQPRFGAY